jgi:predicted DCC family thiol-disulfide oxidoreductase YuxK
VTGERIILFDGVCNLCNGFVQFVLKRDSHGRFRFASLQSDAARRLLGPEGPRETIVLVEAGKTYVKSAAGLRIVRGLRFPWPLLAVCAVIPRTLRDRLYDWVARNRYRWFGKRDACMLPTPQMRGRFVK